MSLKLAARISELKIEPELRETVRAIAEEANDFGIMNSSVDYLAWKCDCTPRTIQRHLVKLRQLGALVKVHASGFHRPTTYRLNLDVFPFKPAFVPKGDTLDTRDRHDGIFVPPPKGDTLSSEVLISTAGSLANSLNQDSLANVQVPVSETAKSAVSLTGDVSIFADAPLDDDDPFTGAYDAPPKPKADPKLDENTRRIVIQAISVGESRGNKLSGESRRGFEKDWLDEVTPMIQGLFGYAAPTGECYTVARSLLNKKRPKLGDKPASYMEILNALAALAASKEARLWRNNPRVNPYMVPMWIERQLAQVPETSVNGSFVI